MDFNNISTLQKTIKDFYGRLFVQYNTQRRLLEDQGNEDVAKDVEQHVISFFKTLSDYERLHSKWNSCGCMGPEPRFKNVSVERDG
jgi:hypothetical protein